MSERVRVTVHVGSHGRRFEVEERLRARRKDWRKTGGRDQQAEDGGSGVEGSGISCSRAMVQEAEGDHAREDCERDKRK